MNCRYLAKHIKVGSYVRPLPTVRFNLAEPLPAMPYVPWEVREFSEDELLLRNERESVWLRLALDRIHDYRKDVEYGTDGVLFLNGRIVINAGSARFDDQSWNEARQEIARQD